MIKWGLSWKLLKQFFIILLISCFTLLVNSSVKAFECEWVELAWWQGYNFELWQYWLYNTWNADCSKNFDFNWTILDTNFNFWNWYVWEYQSGWAYLWRTDYWLHYQVEKYNSTNILWWVIDWFFTCSSRPNLANNYLKWWNSQCTYHSWFDSLSSYLENVNAWGYICKRTSSIANCAICSQDINWNFICLDSSYPASTTTEKLSASTISSLAKKNPFSNNNSSPYLPTDSIWTGSVDPVQMSWDYLVQSCTYQEILDYIEDAWVSKYLCYWGLNNFDLYDSSLNYNPIPWTWKTIQEILAYSSSWSTPKEWFDFWNWLRWGYVSMWESYPAVYKTWFDIYYQYWWDTYIFDTILEYCNILQLDIDYSSTIYNWQYFKNACTYWVKNPNNNDNDWAVWVNRDWVWGKTWQKTYTDWITFIQDWFQKLKENIPTKYDLGLGVLPAYIISFMGILVLFRFIAH